MNRSTRNTFPVTNLVALTNAWQTIYTVKDTIRLRTIMMHAVNTSAVDAELSLCMVPDGGSPLQSNALLWGYTIPANDFIEFGENTLFTAASTLQALASANDSINFLFSALED